MIPSNSNTLFEANGHRHTTKTARIAIAWLREQQSLKNNTNYNHSPRKCLPLEQKRLLCAQQVHHQKNISWWPAKCNRRRNPKSDIIKATVTENVYCSQKTNEKVHEHMEASNRSSGGSARWTGTCYVEVFFLDFQIDTFYGMMWKIE